LNSTEEFSDVIPTKSKVSYGGANAASNTLSSIGFAAITFYYNVKLGLSAELIGIAWLLFAAWNAINDPVFGILQERTKSKLGRRIPYIRYGAPIYGILFILCWFPLVDINSEIALFLYLLFILFAFDTIVTIVGLIIFSLPSEMAISVKERTDLVVYSSFLGAFSYFVSYLLPVFLLTGDQSAEINPLFPITMISLGVICAIIMFVGSYFLKENEYAQLEETLGFFDAIKETFKNKPFLISEGASFTLSLASTIMTSAIYYYVAYVLALSGFMATVPLLLIFSMIFGFIYIHSRLIKKYGLKKVYIFGLALICASFIFCFFLGSNLSTAFICFLAMGIGYSAIMFASQLLIADIIDYDETRTGKRRETTYSGINALIVKPAQSVANWLFLLVISLYGFQEGSITQSDTASFGVLVGFTVIPAISTFLGVLFMIFYPLDGPEWTAQKIHLKQIHAEKEKNYLELLKKQGKL
jgi:GPH family glycoside/pentoside/hexuronide:cation symporter